MMHKKRDAEYRQEVGDGEISRKSSLSLSLSVLLSDIVVVLPFVFRICTTTTCSANERINEQK